eukprot:gnl/MRDRNA2_/MRDRNA2_89316_c0_seq1.p1 gnl/MRDRNA2_/MRDRNA2_89316_c0~~gnl/MRDRNA2_/MRDRNA2_89316_c0_seq1.p1  ORF type:complete len:871 (+),score=117.64 gnl/MRDRNA2_/MRDRNA2_89316_c0_seq1:68-2680(+)
MGVMAGPFLSVLILIFQCVSAERKNTCSDATKQFRDEMHVLLQTIQPNTEASPTQKKTWRMQHWAATSDTQQQSIDMVPNLLAHHGRRRPIHRLMSAAALQRPKAGKGRAHHHNTEHSNTVIRRHKDKNDTSAGNETKPQDWWRSNPLRPVRIGSEVYLPFLSLMVVVSCAVFVCAFLYFMISETFRYCSLSNHEHSYFTYVQYRFSMIYRETKNATVLILFAITVGILGLSTLMQLCWPKWDYEQLPDFQPPTLPEAMFNAWKWVISPDGGSTALTPYGRICGIFTSLGGLTVFALLISIMADKFGSMLKNLRQGMGTIVEGQHIVVLGQSLHMCAVIKELAVRGAADKTLCWNMAVLTKSRDAMMQQLERIVHKRHRKHIAVREGLCFQSQDLRLVSAQDARAIVVLADVREGAEFADRHTAAVLRCLHDLSWPREGHVIAQCMSHMNLSLLEGAAGPNAEIIELSKLMGRMLVRCMTEPAWPMLLNEVFCTSSHDVTVNTWEGKTTEFQEVVSRYPQAVVLGVFTSGSKSPKLCPKPHALVNPGDDLVLVTAHPARAIGTRSHSNVKLQPMLGKDESVNVVFIGWNELGLKILDELNNELPHASVTIVSKKAVEGRETAIEELQASNASWSLKCTHLDGNPSSQVVLTNASVDSADILAFLAEDDMGTHSKIIDEQTVAALLAVIESLGKGDGRKKPRCIVQVLNPHTEEHLGGFANQLASSSSGSFASQLLSVKADRRTNQIQGTERIGNLTVINSVTLAARILGVVTGDKKLFPVVCELPNLIVEERALKAMPPSSDRISFWEAGKQFGTTMESCVTLGWRCLSVTDGKWELNPLNKDANVVWNKEEDRLLTVRLDSATKPAQLH